MKAFTSLLMGLICLFSVSAMAQKMVPYSFQYQAETSDRQTSDRNQLRFLTQVTQPNTTFLRLYFTGTKLGDSSYLVLEGTDGARQELRKQDLENWQYSSAFFNGQSVNVSLFTPPDDRNTVTVSGIKVSDESAGQPQKARLSAQPQPTARQSATTSGPSAVTYPYAKAVGRFTNGTESYGTGWIAPNGAIVTSAAIYANTVKSESYDVIEFNVPPSIGTTVQHPLPQDQYPVSTQQDQAVYTMIFVPTKLWSKQESNLRVSYAILTPLPNSTGLRPGERQQAYFRIATNPSSSIINSLGDVPVDVLHYGAFPGDSFNGQFRTLRLYQNSLLKQNDYLSDFAGAYRDEFVLYDGAGISSNGASGSTGSDAGAPITYRESNVAIGLHVGGYSDGPSYAIGFRNETFRNDLARFFASNAVYVDPEGLYDPGTGEIHKPYRTENKAASDAPAGAQVYFARGDYPGPVTFNRPMTLRAPVGKVTMGVPFSSARKAAESSVTRNMVLAEAMGTLSQLERSDVRETVRAYPNPFKEQTEIKYPFAEGGHVSVDILNTAGVPVAAFRTTTVEGSANAVQWNGTDQNGMPVPTGLYIIKVNDGHQTFTTKVLKQ